MKLPAFRPRAAAVSLLLLLLATLPAPALILKLTPLKEVIEGEEMIFVATVDRVEPERPGVVFKFDEKLKGEVPFEKLAVNLTGDAEAKKGDHTKVMLDRLEAGRKLVLFVSKQDGKYSAFGFLEGTWFQMQGTPDGKAVRWAFLHCEPYLRRTFKGTTAELQKVVADALAKKAAPPGPNEKEPPGYGPPVEKKPEGCDDTASRERERPESVAPVAHAPGSPALFAVIPSFVLVGPLAVIAALFPGVAARMAVGMKRWRAFLVVASVNSTLAIVFFFVQKSLPDWWAFSDRGLLTILLASTTIGLCWAGRRYRRLAGADPAVTGTPTRSELTTLVGLTLLIGLIVASVRLFGPWSAALEVPMREFTFIGVGLLVATIYAAYRAATRAADRLPDGADPAVRLSLSGESVGLGTLFACGLGAVLTTGSGPGAVAAGTQAGDADDALGPRLADVRVFEVEDAHQVLSSVTVAGDRLFFGAGKQTSFRTSGFVFCLDRDSGKPHWSFKADTGSKPVFCTPTVAGGRVYVGEGLHTDSGCRLFCLDAATGKPAWEFPTASHTEGTPRVVNGRAYFSAGDDGLFCVDASSGAEVWHFPGSPQKLHIDTPPAVAGNRVFAGSGYDTYALLCVAADTGKELWRTPVAVRSFGTPLVLGNRACYGLGTGNLTLDLEGDEKTPAGAVVCVEADAGKEVWRYELGRSVHTPLAADAFSVYATSRDGAVHCLDRRTGKLRWKTGVGATITAGPAVATAGGYPVAVYAVSTDGMMVCLNPQSGKVAWARNLREYTGKDVEDVFSTPTVVTTETPAGSRRVIYIGAQLKNRNNGAKTAAVFRFEDELGGE
jgi:outer membrane protein assembly factor BamB